MNSKILAKINNFAKNRLIELFGIILVIAGFFLLASIVSYDPSDPNFIYSSENTEIKNIGGFYGSVASDFLLQAFGLIAFFLVINFLYWGFKMTTKKVIDNFIKKIFFTLIYLILGTYALNILHKDSFWLIDNGNGGFLGQAIKDNVYYFAPLIENNYALYIIIILALIFFILSLDLKFSEIQKLFSFPFFIFKKILNLFKKDEPKE